MRSTACSGAWLEALSERDTGPNPDRATAKPTAAGAIRSRPSSASPTRAGATSPRRPGSRMNVIGTAAATPDNAIAANSGSLPTSPDAGVGAPISPGSGIERNRLVKKPCTGSQSGLRHGADLALDDLVQRLRAVAWKGHCHRRADAFGAANRQRAAVQFG